MSEPDFNASLLAPRRIAILGIGLIGGSLALALQGKCSRLFGVDPDPGAVAQARRLGIFDQVSEHPADVVPQADFLLLCAPVRRILSVLESLPRIHSSQAVVLDTGSTKVEITKAMQSLPEHFLPVGGHPMAGKEVGGLVNADAALFKDVAFALVRVRETTPAPTPLVESLVGLIGARPVWLEAEAHDQMAAAASHLPYLVSCALARSAPQDSAVLAGPGFRSSSRLAATPPEMMLDVMQTNRSYILDSLATFAQELSGLTSLLAAGDDEMLAGWLESARSYRAALIGKNL